MVGVWFLAFVFSGQTAPIAEPDDVYPELVRAYYSTRMPHPDDAVFHGIQVVGERSVENRPTQMVCVNYTSRLRFGGQMTQTEALYFEDERVVKREGGNEALNACIVLMFAPQ